MPRIQSPIRNRPIPIQTPTFNYKQFLTCLIALAIIVCSVLFCEIQDILRYLKLIVLIIAVIVIIVTVLM
jgi:hypothetical protein